MEKHAATVVETTDKSVSCGDAHQQLVSESLEPVEVDVKKCLQASVVKHDFDSNSLLQVPPDISEFPERQAKPTLHNEFSTAKFTYIDLFAGIGGFHSAADKLGGRCVFASEIDTEAQRAYAENYGLRPHGDITKIDAPDIPDHDILFAGFPCQSFSIIGKRKGFDDIRGTMFFEIARILEAKKPSMLVLENVKQLSTHDNGRTLTTILEKLDVLGYKVFWKVLNALDHGLPQRRERTIIVGFRDHSVDFGFPEKVGMTSLAELLEEHVDTKHYATERITAKRLGMHESKHELAIWHENKSGNISSYPYSCALRANASYNYLLVNGVRRLTPREMLRLQGFPDSFKMVCSDSQTRKQAGNAVPVTMIKSVLREVLNAASKTKRQ